MKALSILLAPTFWSLRNDIVRFNRSFYKKLFFYAASSGIFIFLVTKLLNIGMTKLQNFSADVFSALLIKGYSLIFAVIFFIQIINGFVISLGAFYQAKDLEVLFTSPVERTSLFLSRLFETHFKASWMLIIFGIPLLASSGLLRHANPFYYLYAILLFAAFSIIPVNIGSTAAMLLSSLVNIRKMKKFLLSAGILAVALFATLMRIFRPERFVNPELFANLTLFIAEMKTPDFILLPNRWLSESVFSYLGKTFSIDLLIYVSLLLLTAYVTAIFLFMVFKRFHYRGWVMLQDGGIVVKSRRAEPSATASAAKGEIISKRVDPFVWMVGAQSGTLIKKDLLYQVRDPKNVHQMLILISLIVIYLFSVASLPLNWEGYAIQLKYIVSFFNLGLVLIIIAALCARLVYPAVVSERSSFWLLKSSPLTPKRLIWTKFFFFLVPIFLLGQALTLASSFFIGVGKAFALLQIATTALLSLSLVSLAVASGVSDFRREAAEAQQEETKTGGTALMLGSVFLILVTLALEIIPTFLYFLREAGKTGFTQKAWIMIGGAILLILITNLIVTALSIRVSIRKVDKLELG